MAGPVIVNAQSGNLDGDTGRRNASKEPLPNFPPVSAYSFTSILQLADSADLRIGINGIASICAKAHMSLAEQHAEHRPPVGEVIWASYRAVTSRALTSVPEGSSGRNSAVEKDPQQRSRIQSIAAGAQSARLLGQNGFQIALKGSATTMALEAMGSAPTHDVSPAQTRASAAHSLQRLLTVY